MRLLLIAPANKQGYKTKKNQFLENIARTDYFKVPSLALGILAAMTPPDWEVQIVMMRGAKLILMLKLIS